MTEPDSTDIPPTVEIKAATGRVLFVSHRTSVKAALEEACAQRADLGGAYLGGAYLRGAYLGGAYLGGAYLRGAYLRGADLRNADLGGADLGGADLRGAYLRGAKNAELAIAKTRILPDEGPIIGWKKARDGRIVKLRIPAKAKRSHASGRKCRASQAKVLAIWDLDGTPASEAFSQHDHEFRYAVGETLAPTQPFDENPWNECAPGIHFFITRLEAENHV
jgi:hypothetical protein